MKKYLLSTLAIAGVLACTTTAFAMDQDQAHYGPYVVGEAGWAIGTSGNDDAGAFALGAGYHINDYMRADMTVGLRPWGKVDFKGTDDSKADLWSIPVLANMYMSYPIYRSIEVYGMGGLGMAWNKTDSIANASGKKKMDFAWTAGAGVSYAITPCWALDLGYRYTDLGEAKVSGNELYDGKTKRSVKYNDIKLSARYYF